MASIECSRVCKSFTESNRPKSEITVLDNLSFSVPSGQFVSIVGPNGCGKTTLLYIISRILKADSGEVSTISPGKKDAKIGFVFQDYRPTLFPWRRNIDNITLPLEIAGFSVGRRRKHAWVLLSKLNIDLPLQRFPYELSGGQQQLLAISRAFVMEPDVLILDETFSALDCLIRLHLQQKLQDIWLKVPATTIFVTHDIDEAIFLADRVVVLSPRPAQVISDFKVELPRPRDTNTRVSGKFAEMRAEVLKLMGGERI